ILSSIPTNVFCAPNSSVTIPLNAFDAEGDLYTFDELLNAPLNGATVAFNQSAKTVTYTPAQGFTGSFSMIIGVKESGALNRGAYSWSPNIVGSYATIFDAQKVVIAVGDSAATGSSRNVSALASRSLNNAVVAKFVDSDNAGVTSDWTARIDWGDGQVTDGAIVMSGSNEFSVLGAHEYEKVGQMPITVDVFGNKGSQARIFSTMEVRPMLTLSNSKLVVNGSDNSENISLTVSDGFLRVNVGGVVTKYVPSAVTSVQANLFGGNDTLSGNTGAPAMLIYGGEGTDDLRGGPAGDTIYGEAGRDFIDGRDGNDRLDGGSDDDTIASGSGKNTLYGGDGDDRLTGSGGRELMYGQGGADRLYGRGGDDTIDGGSGVDRLYGEDGNDLLIGGSSNDKIYAGPGNDTLYGNAGDDLLRGDEGDDILYAD
ncbi:MAG TPA: calcium-binding protein, partial [Tepidisphaeraceae bacterium]|nr:calcium-binding protein [Tepidisphaeraceae bacterium]